MFPKLLNRVLTYKNRLWNQNLKVRKVRKTNTKTIQFKRKQERKDIKVEMMCVAWPLDVCLLILHICTYEHYMIALKQNTSK